jgi:tetratricopeptide (TPR) repeat protein
METASFDEAGIFLTNDLLRSEVWVCEAVDCAGRQRWLREAGQAASESARVLHLNVRFRDGGPWAGLRELFQEFLPGLLQEHPDLVLRHNSELAYVLPACKKELGPRNQTLTDLAPPEEKVRNYPADRAYRVVHGLVELLNDCKEALDDDSPWVLICDGFENVSHIGARFFRELWRRRKDEMRLSLILTAEPGGGVEAMDLLPGEFKLISLTLPGDGETAVDAAEMRRKALELEGHVGRDPDLAEAHAAEVLRCLRLAGDDRKRFYWLCRALEIYNSQGFYEDALEYGWEAWRLYPAYGHDDQDLRWSLLVKLFMSTVGLQRAEEARDLVEASGILSEPLALDRRAQLYYLLSMLHVRYLPAKDLDKGEEYLEKGLADLEAADMPEEEYHFYWVFNRNGLALIRHFQGRYQEAISLCKEGFERLNLHLSSDKHKLHRSVLLYNIAQVYAAIGSLEESVEFYSAAIAMDPTYSEYYNDRGSLYLRMGRFEEAETDYLRAIELSPPYHEVWTNLGQCYRHSGAWPDALRVFSTAIDLQPRNPTALFGRGQVLEALSRNEDALKDYDAALEIRPDSWDALGCRAVLLYQKGELEPSVESLSRAIALRPQQPDLLFNRAVALADLGRVHEAISDLESCLRLDLDAEGRGEAERRLEQLRASAAA